MSVGRWYKVPFVVGNHIGTEDGIIVQNGYIACFQTFLLLTTLGMGADLSAWLTQLHPHGFNMADLGICLLAYMISSFVLVILMFKFRIGRAKRYIGSHAPSSAMSISDRIRQVIKHKLPLLGIVCFFIFIMILDIFTSITFLDCLPSMVSICGHKKVYEWLTLILFHIFRVAFMGSLVGFALCYHDKMFTTNAVKIRYILMVVLASTVVMWFDTLMHDFSDLFELNDNTSENGLQHEYVYPCSTPIHFAKDGLIMPDPIIESEAIAKIDQCLNRNTTLFQKLDSMTPFFYPLHIEFALLVTEILGHLFFSVSHKLHNRGRRRRSRHPSIHTKETPREHTRMKHTDRVPAVAESQMEASETFVKHRPESREPGEGLQPRYGPLDSEEESDFSQTQGISDQQLADSSLKSSLENSNTRYKRKAKEGRPIVSWKQNKGDKTYPSNSEITPLLSGASSQRLPEPSPSRLGVRFDRPSGLHEDSNDYTESSFLPSSSTNYSTSSTNSVHERKVKLFCSVLMALLINAILFTMSLLAYFGLDSTPFEIAFHAFIVAYYVLIIVFIFVVLKRCEKFTSKFQSYSGMEMIVVASSAGCYLYATMSLTAYCANIADMKYGSDYITTSLILLEKLLELFCLFIQTTFMLHATRIEAPMGSEQARASLKQCLIFLAISNISTWAIDSFLKVEGFTNIEFNMRKFKVGFYSDDQWKIITHLTLPLFVFYRFNSFFILLGGYLDHRLN